MNCHICNKELTSHPNLDNFIFCGCHKMGGLYSLLSCAIKIDNGNVVGYCLKCPKTNLHMLSYISNNSTLIYDDAKSKELIEYPHYIPLKDLSTHATYWVNRLFNLNIFS